MAEGKHADGMEKRGRGKPTSHRLAVISFPWD